MTNGKTAASEHQPCTNQQNVTATAAAVAVAVAAVAVADNNRNNTEIRYLAANAQENQVITMWLT